jgi:sodium transport system permease protein
MNLRIVYTLFMKELLDTARDKRTLIMMVGVPVLLYPGLMLAGLQVALLQQSHSEETVSRVAFTSEADPELRGWVASAPKLAIEEHADPQQALAQRRLDAVVVPLPGAAAGTLRLEVLFDSTEFRSVDAATRLADLFDREQARIREERVRALGMGVDLLHPVQVARRDIAPPEKTTGNLLGMVLPAIMVIMLVLGAFYPAVDVTAGEKERGTFETLLSTPITKLEIVTGKYLTVLCLSFLTGLLNLVSMAATFAIILVQMRPALSDTVAFALDLGPLDIALLLLLMLPLAAFISALTMCTAIFARSFREAQNYVTPLFLLVSFPALYASMPAFADAAPLRLLPIANVVVAFREVMTGQYVAADLVPVMLSSSVFATLAILAAAWIFQREEVVLSEERGLPVSLRRAHFRPRAVPTPGMALGLFSVVMLLLFYVASPVQAWSILPGLLLTEWGLLLLPTLAVLWFTKTSIRESLLLHAPPPLAWPGSLLLGLGWVVILLQVGVWHQRVLPLPEDALAVMEGLFAGGGTLPGLLWLLFCVAISAALCEEVVFRGFIQSGLRPRLGAWPAVVLTALLFGAFHLSVHRFLPTALTGLVIGAVALRTASLGPGILLHVLVNGLSVLVASGWITLPEGTEERGAPGWLLALAALAVAAGWGLISAGAARSEASGPGSGGGESAGTPPSSAA